MSRGSVAETSATTILTAADFESWTQAPKITPSDDHTNSTSTRIPSHYDKHVPEALQPQKILLGKFQYPQIYPTAQQYYFSQLLERPNVLENLSGKVRDNLAARWSRDLLFIESLDVRNEEGVVHAEMRVAEVVYDLAALAILDLSKDQVEATGLWAAFGTHSSAEKDTKADLLLGLASKKIIIQRDSRNDPRQAIWPSLQHLNADFMRYLLAEECKNLRLGGPMGYLVLLLFASLTQANVIFDLWPQPDCHDCPNFPKSHEVRNGFAEVIIPSDSTNFKTHLVPESPSKSELYAQNVHQEIARVLRLILDERGGSSLDTDVTHKAPNAGEFYAQVRKPILEILQSSLANEQVILNQLGGIDNLLNTVMARVTGIRNIFVQICSQLIRHNLTFGLVSSYNHSWFLQRHRVTAEFVVSPLQQASDTGHIIQRALYFMDAYYDGLERSENGGIWNDPYRGVRPQSDQLPDPIVSSSQAGDDPKHDRDYDPDEVDSEDSEYSPSSATDAHGNKLRRSKRKKTKKRANPGPSGKPPHPPPPGGGTGGAGGAGGAGTRRSKSGTGKRNTSAGTTQGSSSRASSGRSAKRARQKVGNHIIEIAVQNIHLAFNCTKPMLQSNHIFLLDSASRIRKASSARAGTTQGSSSRASSGRSAKRARQKVGNHIIEIAVQNMAFNCTKPMLQSKGFSCFQRVLFTDTDAPTEAAPVHFPIPFSTITPPRRSMAATLASLSSPQLHHPRTPPGRRSSLASVSSVSSLVSSAGGASVLSSGGSIASSTNTAPVSTPPSSPSGSHRSKGSVASISVMHGVDVPGSIDPVQNITSSAVATPVPTDPVQNIVQNTIVVSCGGTILDTLIAESKEMGWIVWGGDLILEGVGFPIDHVRIVIKLSDWERDSSAVEGTISDAGNSILAEAKFYEHLANVAPNSDITPEYHGVFNGSGAIGLVLGDGGDRLPRDSLQTLDNSEKRKIFNKAEHLHRLGILHGDLSERNILMDEDRDFRIIDFHISQLDHQCSWNGSNGCHELEQFADAMMLEL
ncbi:hypothetical protein EV361DRAFT_979029 [Lentinula raphanica]|nr:hypothetical protein EV361DRAFT_979029 [Lentinula raphanica]